MELSSRMLLFALSFVILWKPAPGFITYIEVRFPLPGERSLPGTPWPYPKTWERSTNQLTINPDTFQMKSMASDCDVIDSALQRYKKIILDMKSKKHPKAPELVDLHVNVPNDYKCGYPKHADNESYSIVVSENGTAEIQANTIWGALRGLETFSQLIYDDENGCYLINCTHISDEPRFVYRGLFLDTARHFIPTKTLKKNLDAMAYNKFNAFHWHIIDDQSFSFESKLFPNLTQLGAYSPKHVYTQADIRDLIEYARKLGIRVIPEFDTPGHTQALGKAFPNIITPCYGDGKPLTPNYTEHAAAEILNPMLNETYDIFKALVGEVKSVFVDEYIHLGMDEAYYACWKSNPEISKFMVEHNYTDYNQVEQHYVKKTLQNVKDTGYKYMMWQDPIDNEVQAESDTIVEVWKDNAKKKNETWKDYVASIAGKGYKIILSSCWYLSQISYGPDWKSFYECDPWNFNGTEAEKNLVIGGEVCMWSEYVDQTNVLARLWPRASAVAERLWSSADVNDTDSAAFRLDEQRCRMLRRGIPAQPILTGFCGDYELNME